MRRPTVPAVLVACAAAVIAWTGAAGAATAAPTSSVAAPTGATVTAPAKPAAKTTTATYTPRLLDRRRQGLRPLRRARPDGCRRQGRPAQRAARRVRPGRPAERLQAAGSTAGAGQTVAIVDAYDDPNAEADLAIYRSQYGLPACTTANGCFRKVNQNGAHRRCPATDAGWAGEISLDLDMVSAICPSCHILLVEANSASLRQPGHRGEHGGRAGRQVRLQQLRRRRQLAPSSRAYNHPGVAVTASTGDSGYGVEYPASDSHVTAVGGTSLTRDASARGWTETAWSGAGSGCSTRRTPKPAWQTAATQCARKAIADVSAVADPNTGVAVYETYGGTGFDGLRRHQRLLADHRLGVRAGRHPGRRLLAGVVPVVAHRQPVRRDQRQQRHLHADRALPRRRRLGRPDRARHAERHGRRSAPAPPPPPPPPAAPPASCWATPASRPARRRRGPRPRAWSPTTPARPRTPAPGRPGWTATAPPTPTRCPRP